MCVLSRYRFNDETITKSSWEQVNSKDTKANCVMVCLAKRASAVDGIVAASSKVQENITIGCGITGIGIGIGDDLTGVGGDDDNGASGSTVALVSKVCCNCAVVYEIGFQGWDPIDDCNVITCRQDCFEDLLSRQITKILGVLELTNASAEKVRCYHSFQSISLYFIIGLFRYGNLRRV